jgi:hypothetical protein
VVTFTGGAMRRGTGTVCQYTGGWPLLLTCPSHLGLKPSQNKNHIVTQKIRKPVTNEADIDNLNLRNERHASVAYFDGLGRPIQSVLVNGHVTTENGFLECKDLFGITEYDQYGRVPREYLPFTANNVTSGAFLNNCQHIQGAFYNKTRFPLIPQEDLDKPFADKKFEPSPLNRVLEQGAPGEDWSPTGGGQTIRSNYRTNTAGEVLLFPDGADANTPSSSYPAGELWVSEVQDENGNLGLVYTDIAGRTILSSVQIDANSFAKTLYIYDKFNRVKYVIQPKGVLQIESSNSLPQQTIDEYGFQYKYDEKGRVVEKKVPGAGWTFIVYNKADLPTLTQDGNQRTKGEWSFTKYDVHGRPIMTGIYWYPYSRTSLQQAADSHYAVFYEEPSNTMDQHPNNLHYQGLGYTDRSFPEIVQDISISVNVQNETDYSRLLYHGVIHSITYYDDYDFDRDGSDDAVFIRLNSFNLINQASFKRNNRLYFNGKVTGVKVRTLDPGPDEAVWTRTVTFYDKYGREIQTQADNHLLNTSGQPYLDVVSMEYNFAGELLKTLSFHKLRNCLDLTAVNFPF